MEIKIGKYERSVYSLGASDGLWVGLAMGACVVSMVLSSHWPYLVFVSWALFLGTPYLAWRLMRRAWAKREVPPRFSAVWLHGICIFLFGSLIMALMMYVSLRYIVPGWIETQMFNAVEVLASDPATVHQSQVLAKIIDTGQLPSPIYTSVSSIWFVSFTGSIWSMLFALLLTKVRFFIKLRRKTHN